MNIGSLARKLRLLIVATMIGVSNVIYEEDKSVDVSQPQTEQEQDNEELNKIKDNG